VLLQKAKLRGTHCDPDITFDDDVGTGIISARTFELIMTFM
jgi:hypothetical protein